MFVVYETGTIGECEYHTQWGQYASIGKQWIEQMIGVKNTRDPGLLVHVCVPCNVPMLISYRWDCNLRYWHTFSLTYIRVHDIDHLTIKEVFWSECPLLCHYTQSQGQQPWGWQHRILDRDDQSVPLGGASVNYLSTCICMHVCMCTCV